MAAKAKIVTICYVVSDLKIKCVAVAAQRMDKEMEVYTCKVLRIHVTWIDWEVKRCTCRL